MPERDDTAWWSVEPPDNDFEPPYPDYIEPEDLYPPDFEADFNGVYVNGAMGLDLFAGATMVESASKLELIVPPRIIIAGKLGKWVLRVHGYRHWFKEHDDYGSIAFTANGIGVWYTHQYAFEKTDAEGMPTILDRERSTVEISLQDLNRPAKNLDLAADLETEYGLFHAVPNWEYYNDDNTTYFTDFAQEGRTAKIWQLEFPLHWNRKRETAEDFVQRLLEHGENERAEYISEHGREKPDFNSIRPFDHVTRKEFTKMSDLGGTLHVPVDDIRRGSIHAKISFPALNET